MDVRTVGFAAAVCWATDVLRLSEKDESQFCCRNPGSWCWTQVKLCGWLLITY